MPPKAIDIPFWQSVIRKSIGMQVAKHKEWKDNLDFYTGDWFRNNVGVDPERIEVVFVYSFVNVLIPAIYFKDPYIFTRARSSPWQPFSETMETVINYIWEELRLKQEIKLALLDSILTPPGWIKIGYTADFGEDVAKVREKEGGFLQKIVDKIIGTKEEKTAQDFGILSEDIQAESVFAQYISSYKMLLALGYHTIQNMPYLIEIEDVAMEDLQKNKMYKKKVVENLQPTRSTSYMTSQGRIEVVGGRPLEKSTKEPDMARLFHVWDRRNKVRLTLSENYDEDTLFDGPLPYGLNRFPYYELYFNEVPQTKENANPYPVSDIKSMTHQLVELSQVRTQMARHRKRSGTVVIIRKGQFTQDEISNFENADDISIIEVSNLSPDTIQNYQPPKLPEDVFKINDVILQDLMRESGLLQLLASSPQKGVETLGEARILQAGADLRTSDKVATIEAYTVRIARGLASLVWEFYDYNKISEIVGEELTEEMWPTLPKDLAERRRIINSQIQFKIESGATRPPVDDFVEQKLWQGHMMTLKTLFPGRVKDEVLLEQYLKKLKFKDFQRAIISFDQEETKVAQEENNLISQNIPQLVSPNENHQIHLQIHQQAKPTQASQLHIMEHQKYFQMTLPNKGGQGGNFATQPPNSPLELNRTGSPGGSDLLGAVANLGKGLGEGGPTGPL